MCRPPITVQSGFPVRSCCADRAGRRTLTLFDIQAKYSDVMPQTPSAAKTVPLGVFSARKRFPNGRNSMTCSVRSYQARSRISRCAAALGACSGEPPAARPLTGGDALCWSSCQYLPVRSADFNGTPELTDSPGRWCWTRSQVLLGQGATATGWRVPDFRPHLLGLDRPLHSLNRSMGAD